VELENEYMKRGYLLPDGCKDLIDVLKLRVQREPKLSRRMNTSRPLPPIIGELSVPEQMTVRELAELLMLKPYLVVADLITFGVFTTVNQIIGFEAIARVVRKYGYTARKAV